MRLMQQRHLTRRVSAGLLSRAEAVYRAESQGTREWCSRPIAERSRLANRPVPSRVAGSVLALIVVFVLSSCGGSDEPEPVPTAAASPTAPTPTPSPSPSPTETLSDEQVAAERALDRFLQVEATLYADPDARIEALDAVSYGLARRTAEEFVQGYRDRGFVLSGPTTAMSREVTKTQLRADPPTLVIEECRDTSKVKVSKDGAPAAGVRTTDREKTTYGVSYWQRKWQVSFIRPSGPNAC